MKSRNNTSRRMRGLVVLMGAVISAGLLMVAPAHAATSSTSASLSNPRLAASARAKQTGKPVQVSSLTTADSATVANPNGSFTTVTTVMPTRMRTGSGKWVDLDATLVRHRGGSITTTATADSLTLSGGGRGPVITVADHEGHSLTLTLPVALPAPVLSGASATYVGISPRINLTVTAQPAGGFSEVFTIASAAAARQAAHLRFGATLRNLTLAEESSGALQAKDNKTGAVVMTAPPSAARLVDGGLTLPVDPAALGADPVYPLSVGLSWSAASASGNLLASDDVQAGCPVYTNYDSVTDLGVGFNEFGSCYGVYRSFMLFSLSSLNSSDVITSSTFEITSDYSAYNSCDESSQTVDLDWTGAIGSGTDWDNQPGIVSNSSVPAPMAAENVESDGNSDGTTCSGGVPVDFPVTSFVSYFASQNMGSVTVGMYGNESASLSLERFNVGTASLVTTYELAPSARA